MKAQLNLLHLKYFCDAVVHHSISEAAKTNYVTQSAVSQAIHKLEVSLGVPLIIHSRQKFQITDKGKVLFEQARHIFKAVQNIQEQIHQSEEEITGSLKFICTHSLGMSCIAPTYERMRTNYPQVDLNLKLGNLNAIRHALRHNECEFGIVVYDSSFEAFQKYSLKKGTFHLYQNIEAPHHLIENGILVDNALGMYVPELCEYWRHSHHSELRIQVELSGWEVVARFTERNIGIGFFPDYILANQRYAKFTSYPIDLPPFDYEICAIYNKGSQLSRAAKAFLEQFCVT